jgi:hypothetical protein
MRCTEYSDRFIAKCTAEASGPFLLGPPVDLTGVCEYSGTYDNFSPLECGGGSCVRARGKCEESERDGLIVRDNIKIRVSSGAVHLDIPIALVHRRLIGYP